MSCEPHRSFVDCAFQRTLRSRRQSLAVYSSEVCRTESDNGTCLLSVANSSLASERPLVRLKPDPTVRPLPVHPRDLLIGRRRLPRKRCHDDGGLFQFVLTH